MGKNSRYLNPADKARKEERKKEIKKNKKQRQKVRSAAIEGKDPEQIISELEKLDRIERDDKNPTPLNEALYKDKRKRLKSEWDRILAYYSKEDPERHAALKKLDSNYERSHKEQAKNLQAIKATQEIKLEEIFLPPDPPPVPRPHHQQTPAQQAPTPQPQQQPQEPVVKPKVSVIESAPQLFRSSVTRFVPASVRGRLPGSTKSESKS